MFQITLKAARTLSGYSIQEIAYICNIEPSYYEAIEYDLGEAPSSLIDKILKIINVPGELIYYGREEDCIRKNREISKQLSV